MVDHSTFTSRRDRRRAQRKSHIGLNAATAGRASATALSVFGLVLTGTVAANASADGPEEGAQSATVQDSETYTEEQQVEANTDQQQAVSNVTTASSGEATQASTSGESNNSVVSAAYSGIGTPYVWGGDTPDGFDCSGFINWAYEQAGEGDLPRTTFEMEAQLPEVSSPEPGDIVLSNGSSHAGIYVGDGEVISATTSSGVTVHGMDESWHDVNAIVSPN